MKQIAEWVLPGHPDKLCDQIADRLVDAALALDQRALVGVEVAVHRSTVFVDGRIGCPGADMIEVDPIARSVFRSVGYDATTVPDPAKLQVLTELCLNDFTPGERELRSLSDDQNIVTGYAEDRLDTNFLPLAPTLARWFGLGLIEACLRDSRLGPDGKVIVMLDELADGSARLESVSFSIHHREEVSLIDIRRAIKDVVAAVTTDHPQVVVKWNGGETEILSNGAGDFAVGGPEGDNGLSGKKLVVDGFGPGIPIGGGALSGKDPHKVDRIFALRARQIAKHLVMAGLTERAFVQLATTPGDRESRWKNILFGRHQSPVVSWEPAPTSLIDRWLTGYDLTIDGSWRELNLGDIIWAPLAIHGHFSDPTLPWEIWKPGSV